MHRVAHLAGFLIVLACSGPGSDGSQVPWDASMKKELLDRVAKDQAARDRMVSAMRAGGGAPDSATIAEISAVDSENTAWLEDMVARHGWPDSSTIGKDGASAAFLLVQHAD